MRDLKEAGTAEFRARFPFLPGRVHGPAERAPQATFGAGGAGRPGRRREHGQKKTPPAHRCADGVWHAGFIVSAKMVVPADCGIGVPSLMSVRGRRGRLGYWLVVVVLYSRFGRCLALSFLYLGWFLPAYFSCLSRYSFIPLISRWIPGTRRLWPCRRGGRTSGRGSACGICPTGMSWRCVLMRGPTGVSGG